MLERRVRLVGKDGGKDGGKDWDKNWAGDWGEGWSFTAQGRGGLC
ncbi:MAG: hypothetical protein AAGM04_05445 [Pseudomonadota bacterium]